MSEQQHLSPANAMVLLQRDDGRILAVRHNDRSSTSPDQVTVIGGKLEHGEFLDEGAARELYEETGVLVPVRDVEVCQTVHYRGPDGVRVIGVVFTAEWWVGERRNAEQDKHTGVLWIDTGNPPGDCHPYTREVLANFAAGRQYGNITVAASGGGA
ncbi:MULTISPECIES: NUDIX domain-containing protein [unclassified Streptomyces]|uniref:NUDIX domain-containing protein n=1 Tax=unclassified Streptomyces TaxID=2593676 RepID=UPI00224CDD71|nr:MULTISPECIES: NUDIX domain-containing protein [unclassified Streptomyces]MCX5328383.1 NUDIX domain-containing protein [Streptomyces sp. NBC_00140]MCX5357799.1 NUDIX domain-containing protein [Streptomyces sp. NBC_00124]